jgi:hypothetical protein
MENTTLQKFAIVACVLSLCIDVTATEKSPEANSEYLTVQQSLIPMFAKAFSSEAYSDEQFPLNRLNPKAREYIRFYIEEDNGVPLLSSVGIWLLGFIGDVEDVSFVEQYIDRTLLASKDSRLRKNVMTDLSAFAGCFAGMMTKRDIRGARAFVEKYATVSAWMLPGDGETPENLSGARDFYSYFIMCAYQYSRSAYIYPLLQEKARGPKPYLYESFVDSLRKIRVDKYTELMSQKAVPQKKLNEIVAGNLEQYGEWIDRLMRKQTYAQWREVEEKQKVGAKEEKKPGESFENIDVSKTVEGGYVKAIVRDAIQAFEQVSRTVLNSNAEDAPIKKEVLRDIQKAGLNSYEDLQVTVDVEARVDGFSAATDRSEGKSEGNAAKPTVVSEKKAADVTFRIRGSADIFKRYVPDAGPNAPVSPRTGDVMIQMKRTNDAWYWGFASGPHINAAADMVEDEYLIETVRAATVAYAQIAKVLIDGNYDPLTIPVVDNGKLIPLEKRKKDKDKMAKALDMEKRILEELMKSNLNAYGDHRTTVAWKATLGPGETSEEVGVTPLAVHGYETADVTFVIRNAADVYRKHAPERTGYDSLDKGNLQVHMKRINGKWYWNPFGW